MVKLVAGVGLNDSKEPVTKNQLINGKSRQVWRCPIYFKWKDLLRRCYSLKQGHPHYESYKHCSVCDEWLTFSNFKSWVGKRCFEGLYLDKDLLFKGNKVYSPETCVLVPNFINCLFTDTLKNRGDYPIGVSLKVKKKQHHRERFQSYCHELDSIIYLGYHDTPELAHKAWQKQKIKSIFKSLAVYQGHKDYDKRVEEALLLRVNLLEEHLAMNSETFKL